MRWSQALHATALLIDHHRRVWAINGQPQGPGEGADLLGVRNVAAEENETPGLHVAEERSFVAAERRSCATEDASEGHRTKQFPPAAFSRSQSAWAWSRDANPVIEVR